MMVKPNCAHGTFRLGTPAVSWTLTGHPIRTFCTEVPTADSLFVALRGVSIIDSLRGHKSRLVNSRR